MTGNKKTNKAVTLCTFTAIAVLALMIPDLAQAQSGPQLSQDQRRAIIQNLPEAERQKFFQMSQEEKRAFFKKRAGKVAATGGKPSGKKGGKPGGSGFGRPPPPLVEVAEVMREPLVQTFPITGRLVASQKSAVAARIKGSVSKIFVEVGDRVIAGQVLAQLDVDRLKLEAELRSAEVHQARAKWKSAQAQVDFYNQELKRLQRLRKSAAFSQARYEDKKQEVVKAQAAVDETAASLRKARAQRDLARIDLKDASIKAPFAGAVIVRHISPGAYVTAGAPIVTLLDDETMEIEADVPSVRLGGLTTGRVILIQLNAETKIKARVRAVIPEENPLARTRAVRLRPEKSDSPHNLVANQSVVVEVPQGETRTVMTVPKDAIVSRQSGKMVFLIQNGSARPAPVVIGAAFGGKFEIVSGLKIGQKVVVKGNELLRPGQRVRVREAGKPSGGKPGGTINRRAIIQSLSPEEKQKFFAMSPDDKKKFFQDRAKNGKAIGSNG